MKLYVATVQLAVEAETASEAADAITGLLSEKAQSNGWIFDWGYLAVGGQYLHPTEVFGALPNPPFERGT